jgi:deazaflavin-dependent oxidoreductase (nitroreductase family)
VDYAGAGNCYNLHHLITHPKAPTMADYTPPKIDWVKKHVELYEGSGGKEGTTLPNSDMPCIIVTHTGNKSGAIRKIPLMRVKVDDTYVLVGSMGGQPKNPVWVYNLRANPEVEIRDATEVFNMKVSEVIESAERQRLWSICVEVFPNYGEYQIKTDRTIPMFVAVPA